MVGELATRPLGAGPQVATPEGQCLGRHVLEYALRLDADELDDVALLRRSQDYRCPFLVVRPGVEFDPPLALEGEVVFSCLKGAEDGDGLILRVFNAQDTPERIEIAGEVSVTRARLDESPAGGENVLHLHEIATFRLRPSNNRSIPPTARLMSAA